MPLPEDEGALTADSAARKGVGSVPGALRRASDRLLQVEHVVLMLLTSLLTLLILLNVVTRAADRGLFWVDELAIYTMVWTVMIGASVMLRERRAIAVTLLASILPAVAARVLHRVVDLIILAFALTLVWLSWIWYDPPGLLVAGLDPAAFAATSFNFVYAEPTLTIGIPKYLVWLVMPLSALTMSLHALVNLLEPSR